MVGTVRFPNEGFHEVEEVCIGFVSFISKGLSGIPPESQTETGSLKLQSRRYRYLLRILNVVSLLLRLEGL